ncbi:Dimethyl-sulfide monooxygenase [Lachnellula cervina]|uniref:Dimethyl-sulfide monooxygenase n=1 Tax=Lachnellula cervina TaxID=1316786 RepID=A0A7D8YXI2_9HELO|nr:Dimethyl-sulfide monooxygenase [Lachnellula cervina]
MAEERPKKQWIMNAFAIFSPGHLAPGQWKHPEDRAGDYTDLTYWTDLAKILEAGKFHGLFLADHLGIYDVYKGPGNSAPALESGAQFPIGDPFLLISAMAAATKSLSFAITASTTYENPYATARRFSTLDHLTNGRVGWNVVTSYLESAAKAFGLSEQIPHDERYERADEYLEVVYKLLEGSWKDDSRIKDAVSGKYSDSPASSFRSTHTIHPSSWCIFVGPTSIPLQHKPQSDFLSPSAGKNFAAKHSEAMFLPGLEPEKVRKEADQIRSQVVGYNRAPDSIKFLAGMLVIVDETDEKAQAKYQNLLQYADLEGAAALFGGWTNHDLSKYGEDEDFKFTGSGAIQSMVNTWSATIPGTDGVKWTRRRVLQELAIGGAHPRAIGSPQTVADILQKWIDVAGVDGFNLSYAISPGGFEDMIKYLWPELRKRGVFWDDYEKVGGSMRESYLGDGKGPRLREGHPGESYKWAD